MFEYEAWLRAETGSYVGPVFRFLLACFVIPLLIKPWLVLLGPAFSFRRAGGGESSSMTMISFGGPFL